VTVLSLLIRSNLGAFGRFFVGSWLVEFGIGMVLANHFTEVDSKLRGLKPMVLLFTTYVLGVSFTGFPLTLLLSRAVYGVSLTLLLWSTYNTIKEWNFFQVFKKSFVFIGLNSYATYLINQPFIQEYYVFMMLLFNMNRSLHFRSEVSGDAYNFLILPFDKYLIMMFIYLVVMVYLSAYLTRLEENLHKKITTFLFTKKLDIN